MQQMT